MFDAEEGVGPKDGGKFWQRSVGLTRRDKSKRIKLTGLAIIMDPLAGPSKAADHQAGT